MRSDMQSPAPAAKNARRTGRSAVLRRRVTALVVAVAGVVGGALPGAAPAEAAVLYEVSMQQACKETYQDGQSVAAFLNPWSPYSWYCSHLQVPYPPQYYWQGSVDVQEYCSARWPGSQAEVGPSWISRWPVYRWVCSWDH